MSKKTKVSYYVMVTFDITVGDESNVYKEVSDLLEKKKLKKEISGNELPENVYFGSGTIDVSHVGEVPTEQEIKDAAIKITKQFYKILRDFFVEKKIKYKIFITASQKSTSSIRYTLTKK